VRNEPQHCVITRHVDYIHFNPVQQAMCPCGGLAVFEHPRVY